MWKPWENESETQRIRRQKERYRDDKRWQIIDERKNDPMGRLHTRHRKKLMICGACVFLAMLLLMFDNDFDMGKEDYLLQLIVQSMDLGVLENIIYSIMEALKKYVTKRSAGVQQELIL